MFKTLITAIKSKEIKNKIFFTLFILLMVRLGSFIPVPGINILKLKNIFLNNGILNIMDTFAGGSLSRFTIFALGIVPYINASIIMTLLAAGFDYLKELAKEDNKKITQITRYLSVALAFIQAIGLTVLINTTGAFSNQNIFTWTICVFTLTIGTIILMCLGELINKKGIGNGISLIIFIGIISRIPYLIFNTLSKIKIGEVSSFMSIFLLIALFLSVLGIVLVQQGERRIPIYYSKRVVGRKMYGGQNTFIPIKINQAGVIPIIFASSMLVLPGTIVSIFFSNTNFELFFQEWFGVNTPIYVLIYIFLIMIFTFLYSMIAFNPIDISENLRKNGGFIPGIRPGKSTSETLQKILIRITIFGAAFLAIIALLPNILGGIVGGIQLQFGGTSLLIAVGVALDTMKQIESQLLIDTYQGFLK